MRAIGDFIVKHRGGLPDELSHPRAGTFSITFRIKLKDGGSAILRFPNPGITMFPEETMQNEVATMRCIQHHTAIPVPLVMSSGTREESPLQLGPFIIMEYKRRPLSVHMNELVRLGMLPRAKLPDCTFTSSSDYFQRLAQMHFDHLTTQRNDAIESRTDCQRKQDSQFFGPASNVEDAWQQRLELLSEELQEMEAFVDINMAEMDSRPLAWEPDEDVYTKKVVPGIYFSG
ncbi:phosphotransferase family protein [Metarhizium acridum CQMa 102]|uniref:Phosphotransferase family protein n=1 Tax=Metarhizium acridum (strain CQMa 102) TaxID=655827 RepID=E9DWM5_METAQ|nr:phosphotransferase family protein [Metarhizium acridum CQMa 102]EFY92075.1 phosphotransferase family protein [Metarhizium acridum CQMa 102]